MVSVHAVGGMVVVFYTLVITGSDVLIKIVSQSYPAPQLFAFSCMVVVGLCLVSGYVGSGNGPRRRAGHLRTRFPVLMGLRCLVGLLGAFACFHGFRLLPLAEMFLFFGIIPLWVALLSGPILGEPLGVKAWRALVLGLLGVCCLSLEAGTHLSKGHAYALSASVLAALSLVLARWMTLREGGCLAQVFWPNLAIGVVMAVLMLVDYHPMTRIDVFLAVTYGVAMFIARWLCMVSLRMLPAFVAAPAMNVQFVWALLAGILLFGEPIDWAMIAGGFLILGSSLAMVLQHAPRVSVRLLQTARHSHREAGAAAT